MGNEIYMEGFRVGENQEFKKIVDEYSNRLVYFGQKLGVDVQAAEDITIDVFTKLYHLRRNFETPSAIKAFLFITVRNECINHLIAEQKRKRREADFQSSAPMEDDQTSLFHMVEADLLLKLNQAIKRLPKGCREVFELHYYSKLSNEQIAIELKISESNVTSQLTVARKKLRQLVQ